MNEQEQKRKLEEIYDYYSGLKEKGDQETVVSLLREVQEVCGCIMPEERRRIAEVMQVKESMLNCLIRMYPSLKEAPYQHTVVVCTGERCGRKDSGKILEELKKKLQVDKQGISADKRILLKTRSCLKQCRTSPNVMIDGVIYPQAESEKVLKLLAEK